MKITTAQLREIIKQEIKKKPINEASEVTNVAKKIDKLTANNNHTEAICELAKFIGDKKWITICNSISAIHDVEGHMPLTLLKYRTEIYERLIEAVGRKFGEDTQRKIKSAF